MGIPTRWLQRESDGNITTEPVLGHEGELVSDHDVTLEQRNTWPSLLKVRAGAGRGGGGGRWGGKGMGGLQAAVATRGSDDNQQRGDISTGTCKERDRRHIGI